MNESKFKVQEFVAHSTRVNCLSFGSKSNQVLATGGEDMKVNIWRIGENWSNIWTLGSNKSAIECLCFDSEEQCVVSGSTNGSLKVFDLNEGKLARNLGQHPTTVHSIQYHPYGEFIVSGSADCTMKVWDVRSKTCIQTYNGHTKEVTCVRFSPDGKWVASSAMDGQILLWDLVAGKLIHSIKVQTPTFVRTFEFNPTEFTLAGATSMRSVKFWDLEVMESIGNTSAESNMIQAIAYSNLGSVICTAAKDSLKIWELDHPSIRLMSSIDTGWDRIGDLTISNNFQLIAGSCYSNFVAIYSIDLEDYLNNSSSHDEVEEGGGGSNKHRSQDNNNSVSSSSSSSASDKRNSRGSISSVDSSSHKSASRPTSNTPPASSSSSSSSSSSAPTAIDRSSTRAPIVPRRTLSSDYSFYEHPPQDKDDEVCRKEVGSKLHQHVERSDEDDDDEYDRSVAAIRVPLEHFSVATDAKVAQQGAAKESIEDAVDREGGGGVHVTWDDGSNSHEMATSMGESFWNRFKDTQELLKRNGGGGGGGGGGHGGDNVVSVVGIRSGGEGIRVGGVADEDAVGSNDRLLESLLPPSSYNVVKKSAIGADDKDKGIVAAVVQAKHEAVAVIHNSNPSYSDIAEEYVRKPLLPSFPKKVQQHQHQQAIAGHNSGMGILDNQLAIVGLKNGRNHSSSVESSEHKQSADLLDRLLQDSSLLKSELMQRLSSLRILRQLWHKGEVMETIDHMTILSESIIVDSTNHLITLADFLNAIELKGNGLSLDSCVRILPILDKMISTKEGILSEHVVYSVYTALSSLSDSFGELISSTRSCIIASSGGVDLTREARLNKCNACHEAFSRASAKVDVFKRQFRASRTTVDILDIFNSYCNKYFSH